MKGQSIKVTITSSINKQTAASEKLYNSNTQRHLDRVANHLRNHILKNMKKTMKSPEPNKFVDGEPHYPSLPGHPPAIDTGRLSSSIQITRAMPFPNQAGHATTISTNVWYARKLEEGIGIAARPFMGKSSQAFQDTKNYANKIASDISIIRDLPKPARTGAKIK